MNQEEVIRLDQEAKKEMDEFRTQFNFIYRKKDVKHFFFKDESDVHFMKLIDIIKDYILNDFNNLPPLFNIHIPPHMNFQLSGHLYLIYIISNFSYYFILYFIN
jgi:hypothetical protein